MSYKNTLQIVDTAKALEAIGIQYEKQGGYLKFQCPNCENQTLIKIYGDKKNLYYCPSCKASGHIIDLTRKARECEWREAEVFLLAKAQGNTNHKITTQLDMKYDLEYNEWLKTHDISQDVCRFLGIGQPKGKTMLAGCIAFTVYNEEGIKIAYYGIRMKDEKPVFYQRFNPELYMYNYHLVVQQEPVYVTTDILKCARLVQEGKQCISNFNLPYLSNQHLELLNKLEKVIFKVDNSLIYSFAVQLSEIKHGFYRFE